MTRKLFIYHVLFFVLFRFSELRAQGTDSTWRAAAIDQLVNLYTDSVNENLRLYEGFEFASGYRRSAGHPFFEFEQPHKARIVYKENVYDGVYLAYDITKDEVISVNPLSKQFIQLIKSKVNSFVIEGHIFVHLRRDSTQAAFPGEGFYELLLEGPVNVYAKRRKSLRQPPRAEELARFVPTNTYYVEKDGTYFAVDSRRALLKVCDEHRNEVSKFMQLEKLDFKHDREQSIIRVVRFYERLLN
jgi:hypothetical protein